MPEKTFMDYETLSREMCSRSITQLPALLQNLVRTCAIKPVFKDKAAMLRFVERAWDMGGVGLAELRAPKLREVFEPKGTKFYSQSRKQEMILVNDNENASFAGWLCYQHADGQWVSLRKATEADRAELANAISKAHHEG